MWYNKNAHSIRSAQSFIFRFFLSLYGNIQYTVREIIPYLMKGTFSKRYSIKMIRKKAAIIFGGRSNEHDVSLQSAKSVIMNVDREKYDLCMIGITRDGKWKLFTGDPENITEWQDFSEDIILPPDPQYQGFIKLSDPKTTYKIDVAFPVMHGTYAEDGTIQSVLELAGIPYVGPGVLSAAVTMDKVIAKQICGYNGIPQCKFEGIEKAEWYGHEQEVVKKFEESLGYPMFVKPANMGSSVGINKAKNRCDLVMFVEEAFRFDRKVIVEEFVDGREIECAVIGNDKPEASIPGEVVSAKEFYDYEAKYDNNFDSAIYIPAHIPEEKLAEVRELAVKIYRVLNCRGLSRVDFFLTNKDSRVLLNEVNALPGFTSISMYPKMMMNMGMTYSELIDKLFRLAIANAKDKSKIQY